MKLFLTYLNVVSPVHDAVPLRKERSTNLKM